MKLALGTAQFGLSYGIANQTGQVTRPVSKSMLQLAAGHGIDTLDTAIAYGESEACLGAVGTQGFKLVTKLPAIPDGCADVKRWIQEQVSASQSRLGASTVFGLLLHRPDQLLGKDGKTIYRTLLSLKESGLVQKIGASIYAPEDLEMFSARYRFDLLQAPFNLLDRRLYTSGWLQRLKDEGVEIHTRSVFLQGLLLMPHANIPQRFSAWSELWDQWHKWLSLHSISALQACLAFPHSFPEIDRVIVGADSVNQLEQIISAADSITSIDLPDLQCEEENLINPARWSHL